MLRQDLLSVRQHNEVLLAVCDNQVAVFVNLSYVARVKRSVGRYSLARLLRFLIIALHTRDGDE